MTDRRSDPFPAQSPDRPLERDAARPPRGDADQALRQALQCLPPPIEADRLAALQSRVLLQWHATTGTAETAVDNGNRSRSLLLLRTGSRRGWVLASGLLIGVSLALGLWLRHADAVPEELLQPDVLSQMAIGEM